MRRVWVIVLFLISSLLVAEEFPKDVSPNVPEYGMIVFLVNHGIMELKNGKFSGSEYVSRFEIARYLYNLVRYVGVVRVSGMESGSSSKEIRKIDDLLGYDPKRKDFLRLQSLESKLSKLEYIVYGHDNKLKSQSSKIDSLSTGLGNLSSRLEELENNVSKELDRINGNIADLNNAFDSKLVSLKKSIFDEIQVVKSVQKVNNKRMKDLEDEMAKLEDNMNFLRGILESTSASRNYFDSLQADLSELKNEVYSMKADLKLIKEALREPSGVLSESTPQLLVITGTSSPAVFRASPSSHREVVVEVASSATLSVDEMVDKVASIVSKKLKMDIRSLSSSVLTLETEVSSKIPKDIADLRSSIGELEKFKKDVSSKMSSYDKNFEELRSMMEEEDKKLTNWMIAMGLALGALLILVLLSSK